MTLLYPKKHSAGFLSLSLSFFLGRFYSSCYRSLFGDEQADTTSGSGLQQ
jgi:hypothetical protein